MPPIRQDNQPSHANGTNGTNGHPIDWANFDFGDASEPIAIIGLSSRFPEDATNPENLWELLVKGRSAWSGFPTDRINSKGHYHPDPEHGGTFAVKGGHFLSEDPAYFDSPFFTVTRAEVLAMDVQQRILLENVYHALENAGITLPEASNSDTSVFVSGFNHEHFLLLNVDPELTTKYKPTGTGNSLLAGRVSWFYDFKGNSATVDTACSSSMVSMHLACQSLINKESNMGVVSGVTTFYTPIEMVSMSHHGFLGKEGRCYSFDHRAEGYGRGEGVGTIIVKRLRDALRDGDTVRAVVRASGVNQDGRTAGVSLPSAQAQEALMKSVYSRAGLDPKDTRMVEAHGTGTSAGDPLEANAIAKIFSSSRSAEEPLYVGALKSSIGHMEGAAGVAGLVKGVLILENAIIPANNNFEKPNPRIPVKKWHLEFPLEAIPWPTNGLRRISMNSFGVGGTNGHIIMDDAYNYLKERGISGSHCSVSETPSVEEVQNLVRKLKSHGEAKANGDDPVSNGHDTNGANGTNGTNGTNGHSYDDSLPRIFPLSSFDEGGVQRNATTLATHISDLKSKHLLPGSHYIDDLAYTLTDKRDKFSWRGFAIASSPDTLVESLKNDIKPIRGRGQPRIGYIFTGQGSQWHAMGRELLIYPLFQETLQAATSYYQSLGADWSLLDELARDKETSRVSEPWLSHPACVSLQMAVVDLLRSWGIVPSRVVGHSSGEIAAAYAGGRLSREAAWKSAYFRGVASARKLDVKGAMMAVGLSYEALEPYIKQVNDALDGELVIACLNSPQNQTVSGDEAKIDKLKEVLDSVGDIFARKLKVVNAYHSGHMRLVEDEYLSSLGDLDFGDKKGTNIELFSSVDGQRVVKKHLGADYWVDNMVSPVKFHEAVSAMCFSRIQTGQASLKLNSNAENIFVDTLIEIGPHGAMRSAVKEILSGKINASLYSYHSVLDRGNPGLSTILKVVGFVASHGLKVDYKAINRQDGGRQPRMLADLPPYSFNHTERHMLESRLSKNYRLREQYRHDLLGAPVPDWNSEFPRWRNILRMAEQPWLKDHVVTNITIFPGVGYLTAVLEASLQIADASQNISGFRIRDVSFKRALTVPETKEGVEVMLSFSRMDEASLQGSAIWKRFTYSSYDSSNDEWLEHCTGYVATDYVVADNPIDEGLEAREEKLRLGKALATAKETCSVAVDMERSYDELITVGMAFGPLFQNLSGVSGTSNQASEAFGKITVPDVAEIMPKKFIHPHLIHPATMDSFMHLFVASIIDGKDRKTLDRAMVPTFIKEVWIASDAGKQPGESYVGHGKSKLLAYDKFESDVTIWDSSSDKALVTIKGIRGVPLDSAESSAKSERKLSHNFATTLDPDLLTKEALEVTDLENSEQTEAYRAWVARWQLGTVLRITDAISELETSGFDTANLDGHFARYYEWMKQVQTWLDNDELRLLPLSVWQEYQNNPAAKAELYEELTHRGARAELAMRMGANIAKFLRKEVDPLHLMFGIDDLLDRVYADLVAMGNLPAYNRAFLNVIKNASTNLNILEVGAGVGSSTVPVLNTLAPLEGETLDLDQLRISRYTFTDVSSRFFEKAKEKLKAHESIIEYKPFNVEQDAEKQGFVAGSYDYVFAGNVVHATQDLRKTLSIIHKLLKPGGKLVLQEGVRHDDLGWGIAFGQLPGWWLSVEPERKWSPWIPIPQWDTIIRDAGFGGIALNLADRDDPQLHSQSFIVANAEAKESKRLWEKTFVITSSSPESDIALKLRDALIEKLKVPDCTILNYLEVSNVDVSQAVCVSVMDLEREVLASPTEVEFNNVRQLLITSGALLWVTSDHTVQPHLGPITGIIRTVRWERDVDETNLALLSVQKPAPQVDDLIPSVVKFFKQQFVQHLPTEKTNGEYTLSPKGHFLTTRLVDSNVANNYLSSRLRSPLPVEQRLGDVGRPIKLATASPGQLDKLQWVTDDLYSTPLVDTEVEIEIKAVGLNFRDLLVAMGEYMTYSLGYEASGLVSRVGPGVTRVKPGDRVAFVCSIDAAGSFQTYGRTEEKVIVKVPDNVTLEAAAGLLCVYSTVMYGLEHAARLEKGETILIHAAAGGVGQAAIHYAKYVGAEIFATVSTPEKRELLMNDYGIPADHIFSSRDDTFAKGIMRATNNRGVDVVLNSLAGELLRRSFDLIAPFGRFVEIGKKDAQLSGRVSLEPFLRNVTMTSVELPHLTKYKPQLLLHLMEKTLRLFSEGHFGEAKPTKVLSFSQISEGFRTLQTGKGLGKTVFVPKADDVVPVVPSQPPAYQLQAEASYVLAGGLGGIGRSLARWMSTKGAKHLIFFSRTGQLKGDAADMVAEMKQKGCEAHVFACDVGDGERMKEVLDECSRTLPPIKGVIQGSMVLQDKMFENMTHEMYMSAVKPKIQGSWNLHSLLPQDLDFFVMLSSAAGVIGNRSQANYNAGNTFEDALARYRIANGLPAAVIDLGTVLSVGYVAERKSELSQIRGAVHETLREEEIQHLVEYLMDSRSKLDQGTVQLVSGLTPASNFRQAGMPIPTYLTGPIFTNLRTERAVESGGANNSGSDSIFKIQAQLASATTLDEAAAAALEGMRTKLSSLLATPIDNINPSKSVSSNGIDSLIAMEFRTFLVKSLGADIALLDITGTASVASLSVKVASASKLTSLSA